MAGTQSSRLAQQFEINTTNHSPDDLQVAIIVKVRHHAKALGNAIIQLCPVSRERDIAIEHLETAVMRAVQSVVTEGK